VRILFPGTGASGGTPGRGRSRRGELRARGVAAIELDGNRLTAELLGVRGDPPHLVKAATYHRLALEPGGSGWQATVVLDV
jgi:SHS2 domain-containing protein